MIDLFAILLSHGLLALAVWRLTGRDDLNDDPPVDPAARDGSP